MITLLLTLGALAVYALIAVLFAAIMIFLFWKNNHFPMEHKETLFWMAVFVFWPLGIPFVLAMVAYSFMTE